ncbi:MAG: 16S rRNA (cytosine(1402)-N(4))-methyltransferase RsmH [Armatimonadota bacterium]
MSREHQPVMLAEVLELLAPRPGAVIVDGTVGHGGHAKALLEAAGGTGALIAFDWDATMLDRAMERLADTPGAKQFVRADFRAVPDWVEEHLPGGVDAVLLDLGVNLEHFEDATRGFSFLEEAPLDMRMDRASGETAAAWLNRASVDEIRHALREFGGERHAAAVAKRIIERRAQGRMKTTSDLVEAVLDAIPPRLREKRIHPATRTFQAVRIVVNRELDGLEDVCAAIAKALKPGGRMAVLAYHSGEDGAVKRAFRSLDREQFTVLTRKPLRPSPAEVAANPSARSARLRAIQRNSKEISS